jgi:hypothetical protein
LAISTGSQNPLVVYDDELSIMCWVLLHFRRMLSPIEILGHLLFQLGHFVHLHGAASRRKCIEAILSYQQVAGEELLLPICNEE